MLRPLRVEEVSVAMVPRHFPPKSLVIAGKSACPKAHGDRCEILTDVVFFWLGKRAIKLR